MRTTLLALGWLFAIALGIVAAMQATGAREAREEAAHAAERLTEAQASVDELTTRVDDLSGQMDDLLIELNELETAKAELEAANRIAVETTVDSEDAAPEPPAESAPSDGATKRKNPFAKMFGGVMTDEMAEQSARLSVDVDYGDLIVELDLDDARAYQLREIVTRVLKAQTKTALGDADAVQAGNSDPLREELARILTANELAKYDQYRAALPEKTLRTQYGLALGLYAPQLSEEDHAAALDVIVEESLAASATRASGGGDLHGFVERQTAAFDNAAARLAEMFDADQMAPINRFLDWQQSSLQMVLRMMDDGDEADAQSPR